MKILINLTVIGVFLVAASSLSVARTAAAPRPEDISKELEYIDGVVRKGISDGDMEVLARAHRTMANLDIAVESLDSPREKILFSLAIAYNYINLCPTATVLQLSESTNPTGFTFDCVERVDFYFNRSIKYAESVDKLSNTAMADISFIIGIGYDRLKANLTGIARDGTRRFYDLARSYINKSVGLGPTFDGAGNILARFDNDKYLTAPVIDDSQYNELHRLLYMNRALPSTFIEKNASGVIVPPAGQGVTADENTFVDYQWRFSVKKPDNSWQFVIQKSTSSFHITVKKDSQDQAGSGLNIVCRALNETEMNLTPEALISRSVSLLESAGYEIKSRRDITHNGVKAQEIISIHQYQNLIVKPPSDEKDKQQSEPLVSKQYMIIAVSNGVEYIISFNSLESEYARIFPEYKLISNTVTMF